LGEVKHVSGGSGLPLRKGGGDSFRMPCLFIGKKPKGIEKKAEPLRKEKGKKRKNHSSQLPTGQNEGREGRKRKEKVLKGPLLGGGQGNSITLRGRNSTQGETHRHRTIICYRRKKKKRRNGEARGGMGIAATRGFKDRGKRRGLQENCLRQLTDRAVEKKGKGF